MDVSAAVGTANAVVINIIVDIVINADIYAVVAPFYENALSKFVRLETFFTNAFSTSTSWTGNNANRVLGAWLTTKPGRG